MATEGELRNNISDDSEKVRELQEQAAEMKAEVNIPLYYRAAISAVNSLRLVRRRAGRGRHGSDRDRDRDVTETEIQTD